MTHIRPPAPVYLGPPNVSSEGDNKPIKRIVIHSTVSPCEFGGARKIAQYFRSPDAEGSAQYVIDPGEVVQTAWDNVICWHAPPNKGSLGNEMCDIPGPVPDDKPGTARWKALRRSWRWVLPKQRAMLRRTARLTARQCLAFHIPIRFLSPKELQAGFEGVTTHANVSKAFKQSTHWDPGWWPRRRFMRLVRKYSEQIRENERDVRNGR